MTEHRTRDDSWSELPIDPDLPAAESSATPGRRRQVPRSRRMVLGVIAGAGVFGSLTRYAVIRLLPTPAGHFPWSTFSINITGSFAVGAVLVVLLERFPQARLARAALVTGFLGAYTTFSTYMVDADTLLRRHDWLVGALYTLASLLAGLTATFAGMILARSAIAFEQRLNASTASG